MSNDPQRDDEYDDAPGVDAYDDSVFPYGGWYSPRGWTIWPGTTPEEDDEVYSDDAYDRERSDDAYRRENSDDEVARTEGTEDESWWDEGLIGLLLVAGVALFLFPEPATSGLGIALIAVGTVLWIFDWFA